MFGLAVFIRKMWKLFRLTEGNTANKCKEAAREINKFSWFNYLFKYRLHIIGTDKEILSKVEKVQCLSFLYWHLLCICSSKLARLQLSGGADAFCFISLTMAV